MKRIILILAVSAFTSLFFGGCTASNAQTGIVPQEPVKQKKQVDESPQLAVESTITDKTPNWVNNPGFGNSVGIGEGHIGKKSLSFQRKTAVHNAQVEMARNIKADVGELLKSYQAITGEVESNTFDNFIASYSEGILTETLRNTQVSKSFKDLDGNLYVLLVPSTYIQKIYVSDSKENKISLSSKGNIDAKWAKFQSEEMQKEYQAKVDKKQMKIN